MKQITFDDLQSEGEWKLMKNDRMICIFTSEDRAREWLAKQKPDGYFADAYLEKG